MTAWYSATPAVSSSRYEPFAGTEPAGAASATSSSRTSSAASVVNPTASTSAPHSSARLQPEMSYISSTWSLMSAPSASSTLAMPRLGWCMSTTYEPSAYVRAAGRKSLEARVTLTSLAMSWSTRRAAARRRTLRSSAGIT